MDHFEEVFKKFNLENSIKDYDSFMNDINSAYESTIVQVFNQRVKGVKNIKKGDEKREKTKSVETIQCTGITKKGEKCKKKASEGEDGEIVYCKTHQKTNNPTSSSKKEVKKCGGVTAKGIPCSNAGKNVPDESSTGNGYCFRHIKEWEKYE